MKTIIPQYVNRVGNPNRENWILFTQEKISGEELRKRIYRKAIKIRWKYSPIKWKETKKDGDDNVIYLSNEEMYFLNTQILQENEAKKLFLTEIFDAGDNGKVEITEREYQGLNEIGNLLEQSIKEFRERLMEISGKQRIGKIKKSFEN